MCSCVFEAETTDHYPFRCTILSDLRIDLSNSVFTINHFLKNFYDEQVVNVSLNGSEKFTFSANIKILRHTIKFLKVT